MGKRGKSFKKHAPSCMKGFVELCSEGWRMGWHERNGGNLSYRLTDFDIEEFAPLVERSQKPAEWVALSRAEPALADAVLLLTGSGRHMRRVADEPSAGLGLVQLDGEGGAWRLLWGLDGGGRPTSELPTHLAAHAQRMAVTDGHARVVYHAHTPNLIALTYGVSADDREVTRALWKTLPECVMTAPEGVGVVPWGIPGSVQLAEATREKMVRHAAVLWALHGLFCTGETFDETFGLAHTLEKAAQIHRYARQMNGGGDGFWQTIPDDGLRACAEAAGVVADERFLDDGPAQRGCGFTALLG